MIKYLKADIVYLLLSFIIDEIIFIIILEKFRVKSNIIVGLSLLCFVINIYFSENVSHNNTFLFNIVHVISKNK